jgi:hypothetical protein
VTREDAFEFAGTVLGFAVLVAALLSLLHW